MRKGKQGFVVSHPCARKAKRRFFDFAALAQNDSKDRARGVIA
jgi:hypothetical protein